MHACACLCLCVCAAGHSDGGSSGPEFTSQIIHSCIHAFGRGAAAVLLGPALYSVLIHLSPDFQPMWQDVE